MTSSRAMSPPYAKICARHRSKPLPPRLAVLLQVRLDSFPVRVREAKAAVRKLRVKDGVCEGGASQRSPQRSSYISPGFLGPRPRLARPACAGCAWFLSKSLYSGFSVFVFFAKVPCKFLHCFTAYRIRTHLLSSCIFKCRASSYCIMRLCCMNFDIKKMTP